MKEIPLTRGFVAIVDDEDFERLSAFKWRANAEGYAIRDVPHPLRSGKKTVEFMHRSLLGLEFGDKRQGDHRNNCCQDNRRANLRIATHAENSRNKPLTKDNTSGLKGASWHSRDRKWLSQIQVNGKAVHLGRFDSAEAAHTAYVKAAASLHAEFANAG
jgi:hypothetical protein